MYLKPDEVDIKEPPKTVKRIKNNDISVFEEQTEIPEVAIDVETARKTLAMPSLGIIKK